MPPPVLGCPGVAVVDDGNRVVSPGNDGAEGRLEPSGSPEAGETFRADKLESGIPEFEPAGPSIPSADGAGVEPLSVATVDPEASPSETLEGWAGTVPETEPREFLGTASPSPRPPGILADSGASARVAAEVSGPWFPKTH